MSGYRTVPQIGVVRMPNQPLLNVAKAAEYLGVSKTYMYTSGIPFVKLGSRRLYRVEDLDAYVAQRVQV